MCIGVLKDELMCRLDQNLQNSLLENNGERIMDFTRKPTKEYFMISEEAYHSLKQLSEWVSLCIQFNPHAKSSKKKS